MEKKCFKCGAQKELSEFYKHVAMGDGYLNKCKECTKKDALENRLKNIDRIRAYDRARGSRQGPGYCKSYRLRFPSKYKAHSMVNYHIKTGNLVRHTCEVCGEKNTVAHHDDYSQPLNVRWLCYVHHAQWHAENGEGINA